MYNRETIEVVSDFKYGVTLNYTGNLSLNSQTLYGKDLKTMNTLLCYLKKYNTHPKVAPQLFDIFVASILT